MGILEDTGFVERLQFFDGQRLLAGDLQGLDAFHREMRELHNRSLHQAGVGSGYIVSGERGDREVIIGPGYAIDGEGHEIVLTATKTEQVPPVAGDQDGRPTLYYLTVSYPTEDNLEEAETRQSVCPPYVHGVVRRREEPVFCWVQLTRSETEQLQPVDPILAEDIQQGRKIILAQVEIKQCQLDKKVSIAQRRNARPATQPYIACGEEEVDYTLNRNVFTAAADNFLMLVFQVTAEVNTSKAEFHSPLCYWVQLKGPHEINVNGAPVYVDGIVSIDKSPIDEQPKVPGFDVTVLVFAWSAVGVEEPDIVAALKSHWTIVWMGIE